MNVGIILSGGVGSRINSIDIPKQYFEMDNKMVIEHSIEKFLKNDKIDILVIVCAEEWKLKIEQRIKKYNLYNKKVFFSSQGSSRQESVLNGMNRVVKLCSERDMVIVHDAARPFVSTKMINECIDEANDVFGVMPALKVKDTVYEVNSNIISKTLNRDLLVAGQSPECFKFIEYLNLFNKMSTTELKGIKGSAEIAVKSGKRIKIIDGDENNFKITTNLDIEKYCSLMENDDIK